MSKPKYHNGPRTSQGPIETLVNPIYVVEVGFGQVFEKALPNIDPKTGATYEGSRRGFHIQLGPNRSYVEHPFAERHESPMHRPLPERFERFLADKGLYVVESSISTSHASEWVIEDLPGWKLGMGKVYIQQSKIQRTPLDVGVMREQIRGLDEIDR